MAYDCFSDAGDYAKTLVSGYVLPVITGGTPQQGLVKILDRRPVEWRGQGYLQGQYPDSIALKGTQPVQATIRAVLRSNDGPGDGQLIATTTALANGSWKIEGLNHNLTFDIIARLQGCQDVIVPGVKPVKA